MPSSGSLWTTKDRKSNKHFRCQSPALASYKLIPKNVKIIDYTRLQVQGHTAIITIPNSNENLPSHVRRGYHKFGDTGLPHPPQRPDLAPLDDRLPGHHHANDVPQNAARRWLPRTDSNFHRAAILALILWCKNNARKTETTPKNNCAFIGVKEREMKKNSKHYSLNAPCTVYSSIRESKRACGNITTAELRSLEPDFWPLEAKTTARATPLTFRRLTSTTVDVPHR